MVFKLDRKERKPLADGEMVPKVWRYEELRGGGRSGEATVGGWEGEGEGEGGTF